MSEEKSQTTQEVVKLDTETVLLTAEGRTYLNQIGSVAEIISISSTTIVFKGKELVKTGYSGDYKTVQLFECSNGYFLFCNRIFTKNNWSAAASDIDSLLKTVTDQEVVDKLQAQLSENASAR